MSAGGDNRPGRPPQRTHTVGPYPRRYEEDPALAKLVSDLASYTGSSAPGPHAN